MNEKNLYTIGHSSHTLERFLELLRSHEITAIADVRSVPYSRHVPQFDHENLKRTLTEVGIEYVFLGEELGGLRREKECYVDGKLDFEIVTKLPIFQKGCERLLSGVTKYRIALLCSEKSPMDCHRTLLVSRSLQDRLTILHILADGSLIPHHKLEK